MCTNSQCVMQNIILLKQHEHTVSYDDKCDGIFSKISTENE